jgi:hypothetical protein
MKANLTTEATLDHEPNDSPPLGSGFGELIARRA